MKIGMEKAKEILNEILTEKKISAADLIENEKEWAEFEGEEIADEK